MRVRATASLSILLVWFVAPNASALNITLNTGGPPEISSYASDSIGALTPQTSSPTTLPTGGSVTDTDGAATSTTTYSLSASSFTFTFDHARTATRYSFAESVVSILFTPDTDVVFTLSGDYSANDVDGMRTVLAITLFDQATHLGIYKSEQVSSSTPNASFTVGGLGADTSSSTNTLLAGRGYLLLIDTSIVAANTATASAAATGSVTLSFVPEPSTGLLLAMSMLALAVSRGRA